MMRKELAQLLELAEETSNWTYVCHSERKWF
jgi:hypothetical protein